MHCDGAGRVPRHLGGAGQARPCAGVCGALPPPMTNATGSWLMCFCSTIRFREFHCNCSVRAAFSQNLHPSRYQSFRKLPTHVPCMQMLNQLALRMKDLHALGYVHRDLKPGNVMWLPRENTWTVIDFGCVARAGEAARLAFSLAYAAPEVISAFRRGEKTIVAQVRNCPSNLCTRKRRLQTVLWLSNTSRRVRSSLMVGIRAVWPHVRF